MKISLNRILLVTAIMAAFTACSGKKEVSFDTLEEAKTTARANALWNAQSFRASNVLYQNHDLVSNGDSTQMPDCPQGDGWATLQLVPKDKNPAGIVGLKCSTVSGATGCLVDAEFKTKPFANQDKQCQGPNVVPFPLPKIAK